MAVIKLGNLSPDALPRNRGRVLVQPMRGGFQARKWPKKTGYPTQWGRIWGLRQFQLAARWSANMEPMSWATAEFMAKGTMYLPRDLLQKAMYGTLYEVELPDGKICEVVKKSAPPEPIE